MWAPCIPTLLTSIDYKEKVAKGPSEEMNIIWVS
jgi:hypothetical protein